MANENGAGEEEKRAREDALAVVDNAEELREENLENRRVWVISGFEDQSSFLQAMINASDENLKNYINNFFNNLQAYQEKYSIMDETQAQKNGDNHVFTIDGASNETILIEYAKDLKLANPAFEMKLQRQDESQEPSEYTAVFFINRINDEGELIDGEYDMVCYDKGKVVNVVSSKEGHTRILNLFELGQEAGVEVSRERSRTVYGELTPDSEFSEESSASVSYEELPVDDRGGAYEPMSASQEDASEIGSGVNTQVFESTESVFGKPEKQPIKPEKKVYPKNPEPKVAGVDRAKNASTPKSERFEATRVEEKNDEMTLNEPDLNVISQEELPDSKSAETSESEVAKAEGKEAHVDAARVNPEIVGGYEGGEGSYENLEKKEIEENNFDFPTPPNNIPGGQGNGYKGDSRDEVSGYPEHAKKESFEAHTINKDFAAPQAKAAKPVEVNGNGDLYDAARGVAESMQDLVEAAEKLKQNHVPEARAAEGIEVEDDGSLIEEARKLADATNKLKNASEEGLNEPKQVKDETRNYDEIELVEQRLYNAPDIAPNSNLNEEKEFNSKPTHEEFMSELNEAVAERKENSEVGALEGEGTGKGLTPKTPHPKAEALSDMTVNAHELQSLLDEGIKSPSQIKEAIKEKEALEKIANSLSADEVDELAQNNDHLSELLGLVKEMQKKIPAKSKVEEFKNAGAKMKADLELGSGKIELDADLLKKITGLVEDLGGILRGATEKIDTPAADHFRQINQQKKGDSKGQSPNF